MQFTDIIDQKLEIFQPKGNGHTTETINGGLVKKSPDDRDNPCFVTMMLIRCIYTHSCVFKYAIIESNDIKFYI